MNSIKLLRVHYLPKELEPRILYVSEEFCVAGHLCPCGCGSKIITPLGPNDWTFTEFGNKASLYPSIGNWQLPCRSHYWIKKGKIVWSYQWSQEQIKRCFKEEELQRKLYYEKRQSSDKRQSIVKRVLRWFLR
ncbi:MAG: hypothetical protein JXB49_18180 [Bacteroidales bacterium]|nr:hypothetical protein [Bacteroidales bacterium]